MGCGHDFKLMQARCRTYQLEVRHPLPRGPVHPCRAQTASGDRQMVECATGTRQPTRLGGNQWQPASRDVDHDGFLEWHYCTPVTAVHYVRAFGMRAKKIPTQYYLLFPCSPLRLWEMLGCHSRCLLLPLDLTYCSLEIS